MFRQSRKMMWWAPLLAILSALFSIGFLADQAQGQASRSAGDIAVVVNPGTPVTELTLADVRKVFLGERQYWNKDVPVIVLVRAPVAREREVVLKTIYQMTESQFKQYWVAKIFRSEAVSAPKIVYSSDMTNQLLSVIPGSIAFMEARGVDPKLKIVKVNGRMPGEAGYPLH
jgi:ABC-type phosphate transport system substrate-binding protein